MSADQMNRTLHSINGILIPGGAQVRREFVQIMSYLYLVTYREESHIYMITLHLLLVGILIKSVG